MVHVDKWHRAECSCGWQSELIADSERATAAGRWHVSESSAVTELPPCPPWCRFFDSELTDHDYDGVLTEDPLTMVRHHYLSRPIEGELSVTREERNRLGVVTLGPVEISLHGDDVLSVAGAADLAEQLCAAVELAEATR